MITIDLLILGFVATFFVFRHLNHRHRNQLHLIEVEDQYAQLVDDVERWAEMIRDGRSDEALHEIDRDFSESYSQ